MAYLAKAKASGGRRVIQVTDQKLANPNPDFFSYTMSKHALASTIPMLAMAHAGTADRVYGLAPGAILPSHDQTDEEAEVSHRLNLLGRRTGHEEVADACDNQPPDQMWPDHGGPGPALGGPDLYYYWDGWQGGNWPTHDPCGSNADNHVKEVENPGGAPPPSAAEAR